MKSLIAPLVITFGLAALGGSLRADDDTIVSVFSRTGNGYKRKMDAKGSPRPEYYAISNGGSIAGTIRDHDTEKVTYPKIAGIVAEQLAKQNYHLAPDSKSAELLLVIYWGTTVPFNDANYKGAVGSAASALAGLKAAKGGVPPPSTQGGPGIPAGGMDGFNVSAVAPEVVAAQEAYENSIQQVMYLNRIRDRGNEANAQLLGYIDEINAMNDVARFAGGGDIYHDLIGDIEEPRYYIVVQAYEFRELLKQKKKLLWVTRISVRTHGNRFEDKVLPMMASAASVLGKNSGRLIRKPLREGLVEIGEATVIGTSPASETPPVGK